MSTTPRRLAWLKPTVPAAVREHHLVQDPQLRAYFGKGMNWVFFLWALIEYSVAWPTLHLTHEVTAPLAPVVAAFAALPLAVAWSAPLTGWAISVAGALVITVSTHTLTTWQWQIQVVHIITLFVLTAMTYLRGPLRWVIPVYIGTALTFALVAPSEYVVGWFSGMTVLFATLVALRLIVRSRKAVATESAKTKAATDENAVLAERTRIARDLHDTVAHQMSVVVVAAQTARYRVPDVSAAAAAEFESIAATARQALDEVRLMLGVLRLEEGATKAPNPGIGDIARLVESTRSAGVDVRATLPVDATDSGDVVNPGGSLGVPEPSAGTVGVAAYRIVQEALANATRHAPGSRVRVAVERDAQEVRLAVVNDAATRAVDGVETGGGHGISGMRERAAAVGGTLKAESDGAGGWLVQARLPLRVTPALPAGQGEL